MRQITAKDVAKKAGVSQSSVSRVYFEGAAVSKQTREKVLKAAEELGYRPNELARSLITSRTKIIGLVMKGVQNPFYPEVLKLFTTAFRKHGYSVLFVYTNNDEIQKEDVETLLNYNVAGAVITDASMSHSAAEDFRKYKIPLVLFNRKIPGTSFHSVCCDNLEAGRGVAAYLLDKCSKRMAYIAGDESTSTSREREQGFTEIIQKHGIRFEKYASDYTYHGGYRTANRIVEAGELPEAIFVANDIMALGVLDALKGHHIRVPEQVKVVGFDNIEMAGWPAYELTTWEQPISEMVEETVEYMMAEIAEYTGLAENIALKGRLVERSTTKNS